MGAFRAGTIGTLLAAGVAILPGHAPAQDAMAGGERPELSPMSRVTAARSQAAKSGESGRVFGGDEAEPGEWPFQVALLSSGMLDESPDSQPNAQFCGGSLIGKQWVLTAAHCLVNEGAPVSPKTITVLVGATVLNEGKRFAVEQVIVNEKYDERSTDNDLGLLKLATPADAPAIGLPAERAPDSGKATVTGWGRMQDGTFPMGLMEAEIELQSNATCNEGIRGIYARDLDAVLRNLSGRMRFSDKGISGATSAITNDMVDPLNDNMVCAGTTSGVRDACQGDSGGPLFVLGANNKPTQVGIVSWGVGPFDAEAPCGHANAYGVYTRLANYRDWIKEKTGL